MARDKIGGERRPIVMAKKRKHPLVLVSHEHHGRLKELVDLELDEHRKTLRAQVEAAIDHYLRVVTERAAAVEATPGPA